MEQPAALCGVSLWLAPLGFPRGEAVSHDGSSEPAGLTDEGVATTKKFENSKLNGKTGTNAIHIVAFVNQPLATPHQSQRKHRFRSAAVLLRQLPPGGSQELRNHEILPFNRALSYGSFGSPSWRPLQTQKPLAISIQRTAPLRGGRMFAKIQCCGW